MSEAPKDLTHYTYGGKFPQGPPYTPVVSDPPSFWFAAANQTQAEWMWTGGAVVLSYVIGGVTASKLGRAVSPRGLGLLMASTAGVIGVMCGTKDSAERLLGFRPNGKPLRKEYEGYDQWEGVPSIVLQGTNRPTPTIPATGLPQQQQAPRAE